ncbi:MAG TPA: c-type cytochrome [Puia sp.]|nr:c-type cytochrome [Puia sp.]
MEAQNGKQLFQANCAQCHNPLKVITGPALKGVADRVPSRKLLHDWVHNNTKVLASGNKYFNNLFDQYGRAPMNIFPELSDSDIDAIISYVSSYKEPTAAANLSNNSSEPVHDYSFIFGLATFVLAIFFFGLWIVNSNLRKLVEKHHGYPEVTPVPFYRNKLAIATITIVVFIIAGYYLVQAAVSLGRSKGYQPEQPIAFSHKIHAGLNQISCLLCHGDAWESEQASIPSVNVCMNCHAAINVYHGERIFREDGSEVNPNQEILNLFSYIGYDPKSGKYTKPGRPIEWVKIHVLPDYVFFSHAQHVRAGGVQCQTCHGPIQEMTEVKQFAELSMGWCINCHRSTRVNFPDSSRGIQGNKFYSLYRQFIDNIDSRKIDSVTVEQIGGTECQKCHY